MIDYEENYDTLLKAEWTKKDDFLLEKCIEAVCGRHDSSHKDEQKKWLKSLKDRINHNYMEDYKKKYEDALKKAKENKPLEEIFPELKESEDEKTGKDIISFVEQAIDAGYGIIDKERKDKWIAWLEKRGEQTNPYSGTSFEYNGHTWGMCARDNGVDILCDKHLIKHLEKQDGQKHSKTVKDVWKDMRLEAYAQATGNRHEPNYSDDSTKLFSLNDIDEIFEKISDCVVEQKPIESNEVFNDFVRWFVDERTKHYTLIPSDEDVQKWGNMILEHARKALNNEQKPVEMVNDEDYGVDGLYAALDILKTTLGQVQGYQTDDGILEHKAAITVVKKLYEQRHVKWSEEDEKMLSDITDCIIKLPVFFESIEINGENKVSSKFISEVKNWLKSFKYRVQSQPKQECSEEDENTRNKIIGSLVALRFYVEGNKKFDTERIESNLKELDSEIEWMQNAESQKIIIIPKFRHNDIITSSRNYAIKYLIKEVGVKNELGEYDYVVEDISDNPEYKGRIHNISIKKVDEWGVLVERNNVEWKPTKAMLQALNWARSEFHPDCIDTIDNLNYLYKEIEQLYYDRA